jgi:hypothetical protein
MRNLIVLLMAACGGIQNGQPTYPDHGQIAAQIAWAELGNVTMAPAIQWIDGCDYLAVEPEIIASPQCSADTVDEGKITVVWRGSASKSNLAEVLEFYAVDYKGGAYDGDAVARANEALRLAGL